MSAVKTLSILLFGGALGAGALHVWQAQQPHAMTTDSGSEEKKPLYWVAPMDANYRRDGPGKSPMGMDLVPVYEEASSTGADAGPGAVRIAPHVVNNLGVRTSAVEQRSRAIEIHTVGNVVYDEHSLVHIHPRVAGWVEQLSVKAAGDPVKKGQALYTLYAPQLVNAQEEFLIALKRKNNTLIRAARERLKALQLSKDFIRRLERTQRIRQTVTFFAPQSGVVETLKVREGFYVQPGNTLMSLGQLDPVWVEAQVFERDAALVKAGQAVSMQLDYLPDRVWRGQVDYVYPSLESKTRTLRVRLRFDNADQQLKPNMFARIQIQADDAVERLWVPSEAVIRTGTQNRVVLVLGEGQFKSIAVKLGRSDANFVEVLEGLEAEDEVVTSAQFLIDSESSKSSDFLRMSPQENAEPKAIWLEGKVNAVHAERGEVNITHGPGDAWGWPEMQMDFRLAASVNAGDLAPGQTLHFEVRKTAKGGHEISAIHIMDGGEMPMDHSQMDHSQMDHSQMDHSKMGHSKMDHSKMDHSQMQKGSDQNAKSSSP